MEFTSFETVIKNYLDKRAQDDSQFAITYAKPNKNIKECCKYIFQEVEKIKPKNEKCVGLSDDEVYGMAVHYYDEDDIEVKGSKNMVETVQTTTSKFVPSPEQVASEEKRKQRKPRKPKAAVDPNIPEPLDIPIF